LSFYFILKGTFGFGCKLFFGGGGEKRGWGTFVSILLLGSKEVLLLGSAQCFKKIDDGPINMDSSSSSKKKKL
jgi:hypothetical protein